MTGAYPALLLALRLRDLGGVESPILHATIIIAIGSMAIVGLLCILNPADPLTSKSSGGPLAVFMDLAADIAVRFPKRMQKEIVRGIGLIMLLSAGTLGTGYWMLIKYAWDHAGEDLAADSSAYQEHRGWKESSGASPGSPAAPAAAAPPESYSMATVTPTPAPPTTVPLSVQPVVNQAQELLTQARQLWLSGNREASLQTAERALQILNNNLGPDHALTLDAQRKYHTAVASYRGQ